MDTKQQLLEKYRSGNLTDAEDLHIERMIATGEIELNELDGFSQIMNTMLSNAEVTTNPSSDSRFYTMLEHEKAKQKPKWDWAKLLYAPLKFAVPVAALLFIFWAGVQYGNSGQDGLSAETNKDFASTLLSSKDVSDKIHLVSSTTIEDEADEKIINTLLYTLNNDKSANVRLACIDVLIQYSYLPTVREGLVTAISNQSSPIVLNNLAEAINASGKKIDTQEFKSRINQDLPKPLRSNIDKSLILL